jgi:hypothetical protein
LELTLKFHCTIDAYGLHSDQRAGLMIPVDFNQSKIIDETRAGDAARIIGGGIGLVHVIQPAGGEFVENRYSGQASRLRYRPYRRRE